MKIGRIHTQRLCIKPDYWAARPPPPSEILVGQWPPGPPAPTPLLEHACHATTMCACLCVQVFVCVHILVTMYTCVPLSVTYTCTSGSIICSPQKCRGLVVTCVCVLIRSPLTKQAKGSPCSVMQLDTAHLPTKYGRHVIRGRNPPTEMSSYPFPSNQAESVQSWYSVDQWGRRRDSFTLH